VKQLRLKAAQFEYDVIRKEEILGEELFFIERLADLDRTIDLLFDRVKSEENPTLLEDLCPYFGVVWASARGLCDWLGENKTVHWKMQRVLEVGCGLALPSLLLRRKGARTTAMDFHPDVRFFLNRNLELNSLSDLAFHESDWTQAQAAGGVGEGAFDWVIGSDVLYEKQHPSRLAPALVRWVRPGGRIVIADPGRPYLQAFVDEMKRLGFEAKTSIRTANDRPANKEIFILEFQSKD
jgi:predicted nicotinamide N-methyase